MTARRVLVTGASGFIGRHVCARLRSAGMEVLAGVRQHSQNAALTGCTMLVTGDLAEAANLDALLAGVDGVIHLAGRAHVLQETQADPRAAFERANVVAIERLAQAAAAAGIRRVVFVSSIGVLGNRSSRPLTEEDLPAPAEPYAESKLRAEQALQRVLAGSATEWAIVRPTLVYGPHCPGNMARLARLVARGLPLPLASVPGQRSLIGVANLASLLHTALIHPAAARELFLAADGEDVSLPQLLRALAAGMRRQARLLPCPPALLALAARALGQGAAFDKLTASLRVDVSKAKARLGWHAEVPVLDGLRETGRSFASSN